MSLTQVTGIDGIAVTPAEAAQTGGTADRRTRRRRTIGAGGRVGAYCSSSSWRRR